MKNWYFAALTGSLLLLASLVGCGGSSATNSSGTDAKTIIRVEGSDTMVNLAQAWAEQYNKVNPEVSIQVSGGGSGVGIASLIDGVTDMANASRTMKDKEIDAAKDNTGKKPKEFIVALDALAIYIHKDNPLETISLEELAEIYGENGQITTWSQLGVQNAGCKSDEITRISRQNNSGTYAYFREAVLGEDRDFKLGSIDQSGSKDLISLVASTPCAIGYSGMGYATDEVKWLKITKEKGGEGVEPSVESAKDGSYPVSRPLMIYTLGEPTGAIKEYLDWVMSPKGQQIVLELGYVPVAPVAAEDEAAEDEAAATSEDEPAVDAPAEAEAAATDNQQPADESATTQGE